MEAFRLKALWFLRHRMYVYSNSLTEFVNTMNSPEFSTYMGIGKSDMRIDLKERLTQLRKISRRPGRTATMRNIESMLFV